MSCMNSAINVNFHTLAQTWIPVSAVYKCCPFATTHESTHDNTSHDNPPPLHYCLSLPAIWLLASVSSHIWWFLCTCWYRGSMAGSTDVRPEYKGRTNSSKNCVPVRGIGKEREGV